MKWRYENTDIQQKITESLARNGKRECPNKSEIRLGDILDQLFPGEYKFAGDGSTKVGTFNPDFIDENKRKVVELFGEPYHTPSFVNNFQEVPEGLTEPGRKKALAAFGYSTCVVWCNELKDPDALKQKLIEFHRT